MFVMVRFVIKEIPAKNRAHDDVHVIYAVEPDFTSMRFFTACC